MTMSQSHIILGTWTTDPSDVRALEVYGPVVMHFGEDGTLVYAIVEGEGHSREMSLTYRIDGEDLVTNQPSAPREDRSRFHVADDKLWLEQDGIVSKYVRVPVEP